MRCTERDLATHQYPYTGAEVILCRQREKRLHLVRGTRRDCGMAEVLGGRNYLVSAVAGTEVEAHFIPSEDIFAMFRDDPTTKIELVQALCTDLKTVYDKLPHLKSA